MNDAGDGKSSEKTVFIFNMSEDVWPFIQAIADPHARQTEIDENADLGDHTLFSLAQEDRILFVGARPISHDFLAYFQNLFGIKSVEVRAPKVHTGVICDDILKDTGLVRTMLEAGNSVRKFTLLSYTTTEQFLHLVESIQERGVTPGTPEAPTEEDAWTVNFFGSKSGIRQLAQQSSAREPDFVMPDGVICMGTHDAARIAAKKYVKEHGVVVKTNKGHSGLGVLIFRPGDLPEEYAPCEREILSILAKDTYWSLFPIVIESLVSVALTVGGGSPNVEFKISPSGKIDLLYYGGMRITRDGVFQGMEVGSDALSDQVVAQITDTGFFIAEKYRAAGYRGYFDVDFVAAKSGALYVTESNVRRTGATHVYHMAAKLFGKDFLHTVYCLSNSGYKLPGNGGISFKEVVERLGATLFDKSTGEGVIIVSENSLRNRRTLEYVIFGQTKKRAYDIEAKMGELLGSA